MIILVSGATKTVKKYSESHNLGCLLTPRSGNSFESMCGLPWAADNDCFNGLDELKFMLMLERIKGTDPLFVTAPDVVSEAEQTLELFWKWEKVIHSYNLPVAYVLQDGCQALTMPWGGCEAIFIGGSTEWKLGAEARQIVREAKWRKKWVHMGRVNSETRLTYAKDIGCDSVDGTGYSRFSETTLPGALKHLKNDQQAMSFEEII